MKGLAIYELGPVPVLGAWIIIPYRGSYFRGMCQAGGMDEFVTTLFISL